MLRFAATRLEQGQHEGLCASLDRIHLQTLFEAGINLNGGRWMVLAYIFRQLHAKMLHNFLTKILPNFSYLVVRHRTAETAPETFACYPVARLEPSEIVAGHARKRATTLEFPDPLHVAVEVGA